MYTVDYFINKFENINDQHFLVGAYKDSLQNKKCALGHCMEEFSYDNKRKFGCYYGEEMAALIILFGDDPGLTGDKTKVADINDGRDPRYQQDTCKARILAALYDIKKMQSPEVKEKIVYVAVPVTITEQAKELVMS